MCLHYVRVCCCTISPGVVGPSARSTKIALYVGPEPASIGKCKSAFHADLSTQFRVLQSGVWDARKHA
mgnify:CR=1 FL=1